MLDLDQERRRELLNRGILTVNDDGDETLAGLTLSESNFYLAYEQHPDEAHDAAEKSIYYQLKHRHLVARRFALVEPTPTGQSIG